MSEILGRTIEIHLEDGTPTGLRLASIHGRTGRVLAAPRRGLTRLLERPELGKVGVYLLYGSNNPANSLQIRAYVGEAENVRARLPQSAREREFWEQAVVISTNDDRLNRGHVRYLEARLIEKIVSIGRGALDNGQRPTSANRSLSVADRTYMEQILLDLEVVLPMIGCDLLRPVPQASTIAARPSASAAASPEAAPPENSETPVRFEIQHRSGVRAFAVAQNGQFIVAQGSEALKDTELTNSYATLKRNLVQQEVLALGAAPDRYVFTRDWAFSSVSAAAAVVLDRNSNGRVEWRLVGSSMTYKAWQEAKAQAAEAAAQEEPPLQA